jgi:hypothetical protein
MHSDLVPALYLGYGHETWWLCMYSSHNSNSPYCKRIGPTVGTQWQLSHPFFLENVSANVYENKKEIQAKKA